MVRERKRRSRSVERSSKRRSSRSSKSTTTGSSSSRRSTKEDSSKTSSKVVVVEEKDMEEGELTDSPVKNSEPKVQEKNGEISCSIEETNRIRISLGMKPLNVEKKKQTDQKSEVNLSKTKEEYEQEQKQKQIKERLARMKKQRELTKKLEGKSLGEMLLEETKGTSALDWVSQNRMVVAKKKAEEQKMRKKKLQQLQQLDYEAKDIKGLKVSHDVNDFVEGSKVILTLKDSKVLDDENGEVNEQRDELENVTMADADRLKEKKFRANKAAMPTYTGVDDSEFNSSGLLQKNILSQYDEDEEVLGLAERSKFELNADGGYSASAPEQSDDKTPVFEGESLALDKKKKIEDYYTQEEMVAFHDKSKSKKMRKKKKRRKKDKDDLSIIQELEAHATEMKHEDHGSRRQQSDMVNETHKIENALDDSLAKRLNELEKKKAKESTLTEDNNEIPKKSHHDQIISSIKDRLSKKKVVKHESDSMDVDSAKSSNSIIFSEATDFESRVKSAMEEQNRLHIQTKLNLLAEEKKRIANKSKKKKETLIKKIVAQDNEKIVNVSHKSISDDPKDDVEMNGDDDTETVEDDETWEQKQPLASAGMGSVLSLLRSTGDLKERQEVKLSGRPNDPREKTDFKVKDGVKLEYLDEYGRHLTKKEAFRQLSYRFHGHQPGKKRQEKRLRELRDEIEREKTLSQEGAANAMKALEKRQKNAKQAHVVLSGSRN